MLAMLVLASLGPSASIASNQASDATLKNSVLFVYQGKSDFNPAATDNHDFYALRIMTFDLPHDVARVYTKVPAGAQDITVWSGSNTLNASQFGTETASAHAGQFYIDVPTSHPRTANYTNETTTEAAFSAAESVFSNTAYSSGALRLVNDSLSGQYISPNMTVPSSFAVLSATLTIDGNSTANITPFLSNDAGSTWTQCLNNTALSFASDGTSVRVMFDMTGNLSSGNDTSISSFKILASYTPLSTVFSVHASYVWTAQFSSGRTTLDLSEALQFSSGGTYLIMLYLATGYLPSATGIGLVFDEDRAMNTYTDKDLYFNTSSPSGVASYSVEIASPKADSNAILYSAAIVIVLALAAALAISKMRRPRARTTRSPEPSGEEPEIELVGADEDRRKELVARKKAMLTEIEEIKGKMSSGEISQEAAGAELLRLKKDFRSVRNELNRLSRKAISKGVAAPETPEYESILAALARIDQDFEKGRLPENTYKTIRKDYVQRAARIIAASKGAVHTPLSPLEEEKNKLMEAIVTLDDEREKGEIDDKVYSDLRASYRKQLVELMKKVEDSEERG